MQGNQEPSERRKRSSKWDVPDTETVRSNRQSRWDRKADVTTLDASETAKGRAQLLSAKLAASGKLATTAPPALLRQPPTQFSQAPISSQVTNGEQESAGILTTCITQTEQGYIAEVEINDFSSREHLMNPATIAQICQQSGAIVNIKGTVMSDSDTDKQMSIAKGYRPLYVEILSTIQAKVQVALHKLYDMSKVQVAVPKQGINSQLPTGMPYVQDKVFVGLDNANPAFKLNERLEGPNGSFLQHIALTTGAKVHLRGRGSGFAEQTSGRESFEALHIYINHARIDGLAAARNLCESLLQKTQYDYRMFDSSFAQQGPPPPLLRPPMNYVAGTSPQQPLPYQQHTRPMIPPIHNQQNYGNHFPTRPPPFNRPGYPFQIAYPGQQIVAPPLQEIPRNGESEAANSKQRDTLPDPDSERASSSPNSLKEEDRSQPRRKRRFTEDPALISKAATSDVRKEEQEVTSPRLDAGSTETNTLESRLKKDKPRKAAVANVQATKAPSKGKPFKAPMAPPPSLLPPSHSDKHAYAQLTKRRSVTSTTPAPKGALASLLGYGGEDDESDSDSD